MKIALFSWEARYSIQISGIGSHVSDLAQAQAQLGHEVHVFTRQAPDQSLGDLINGVYYHRCPWNKCQDFLQEVSEFNQSLQYYYTQIEQEIGGFDLIHCHDWLTFEAGNSLRENNPQLQYITTFHTTEWGRSGSWPEKDEPRIIADLESQATEIADSVITISYEVKRQVELLYRCPEWKLSVIYHGISLSNFDNNQAPKEDTLSKYDLPANSNLVLYVGALNFRKGADLLGAAAADIISSDPSARIIFAGEGDMRARLEAEINSNHLGEYVRFIGEPLPLELMHLYHAANIVCIPYRYDPFGVVALSAWAAGKPVIVSSDGAAAEFIYNKVNGLRCAEEKLGESVSILLSETDQARWMGRNGRVAVETAFSWESIAEQTMAVYSKATKTA